MHRRFGLILIVLAASLSARGQDIPVNPDSALQATLLAGLIISGRIEVLDAADKSDPFNQRIVIATKAYFAALRLRQLLIGAAGLAALFARAVIA